MIGTKTKKKTPQWNGYCFVVVVDVDLSEYLGTGFGGAGAAFARTRRADVGGDLPEQQQQQQQELHMSEVG